MKEHDMIVFVRPVKEGDISVPVGTRGCIVHVYKEGEAFAVELSGKNEVVTAPARSLVGVGWDKETWEALEGLASLIKSGELTIEQLREMRDRT
jgi:hypothetical protein